MYSFVFANWKSGEDVIRMLQKLVDSGIFMKFFKTFDLNTGGRLVASKYIGWLYNSLRILVGNAANPSDDCGIYLEFWLEFQLILNSAKSSDCV